MYMHQDREDTIAQIPLTSAELAQRLKISTRKLAYLRALGQMVPPTARIGRSLRFDPDEAEAWVKAGCPAVTEWNSIKRRDMPNFRRKNF